MLTKDVKAVLFDLDGTLLNSIDDIADSMNAALAGFGFPGHGSSEYKFFVGDGMEILARRALPAEARNEKTIEAVVSAMREEYGKRWNNRTACYAGISELLDGITARGLPMAILSNKTDSLTQIIVRNYLAAWEFVTVVGARINMPKKPDPTGALHIAETLGIRPEEFLYLGDTATDMKTANSAGMYAVGATWGFRSAEELKKNGAAVLIDTPVEMLRLF